MQVERDLVLSSPLQIAVVKDVFEELADAPAIVHMRYELQE
jgi:hypothetical protein